MGGGGGGVYNFSLEFHSNFPILASQVSRDTRDLDTASASSKKPSQTLALRVSSGDQVSSAVAATKQDGHRLLWDGLNAISGHFENLSRHANQDHIRFRFRNSTERENPKSRDLYIFIRL